MKKLHLLTILCIILSGLATSLKASNTPTDSNNPSIATFLNADGTLNLTTGFTGSLNLSGFEVQIDACKGIIAKPQTNNCNSDLPQHLSKTEALNSTWSALGTGISNPCYAVAISGSDVYVGGIFTTAGGNSANNIAKWDGTSWSALGTGLGGFCFAIAVSGSDVYVGGSFTTAGGNNANNIAKWDGISWSALGSGLGGDCLAIAVSSSDVYVGGNFTTAGGNSANRIAKWDGISWSALGTGLGGDCYTIAISGNNVYVGGNFTTAGGSTASRIAKWDGTSWSTLGLGVNSVCYAIAISGSDIYAGGNFSTAGGNSANRIAEWDGTSWSALGTGLGGDCNSIVISGNDVYAGGDFTTAGGNSANRIAKWDGTSWSALGSGLNGSVYFKCLAVGNDGLYASGQFTTAGGSTANYIAKWDGAFLPVELTYFKGQATEEGNQLQWQTATEKNNEGFEIERSQDGKNWETIGFVEGYGTTIETQNYAFIDEAPLNNLNYYRLKQVDYDGAFDYSNVVTITVKQTVESAVTIYPNPIQDEMTITNGEGQATIFNLLGQPVKQFAVNSSQSTINMADLPKGQYILQVQKQNGMTITKRFVK